MAPTPGITTVHKHLDDVASGVTTFASGLAALSLLAAVFLPLL